MRLINVAPMLEQLDLEHYDKDWYVSQYNADWISSWLESQPVIDAEPVKHGRWEETVISYHDTHTDEYWDDFYYEHKACGYQGDFEFNYCPNCGCKMDLEET